ncbi:AAA family ATPase [Alcanivorax sp. VBW004]|uniref:AAA family ATPase n=1 Tax=Alcanivorax sp. VBW004 TaxID=1287708 RepID=UPI0012BD0F56|nr:AAA family ATPase [Alcanivorax sp. VBW004]MTT53747.1 AAA family ATPase [Alcanivorax sp. VBW004]
MVDNAIKRVELCGIHKRYDLEIDFNESLNILYGHNGTGKSTLIHIIANVANCDFIRFAFLNFKRIRVDYYGGECVEIRQEDVGGELIVVIVSPSGEELRFTKREASESIREMEDDRYGRDLVIVPELPSKIKDFVKANGITKVETSYFPAFRTMLEAWSSRSEVRRLSSARRNVERYSKQATVFSRDLFGHFLPKISYPSPIDIELNLRNEIRDCQIKIARYESSVFSDSFVKVFSALLDGGEGGVNADEILLQISDLTKESNSSKLGDFEENSETYRELQSLVEKSSMQGVLQSSASGALAVYRDALKERQLFQQKAFKEIDAYFEVVNSFLDKKELAYEMDSERRIPRVGLKFPDGSWSSIRVMSSGERQLLTMLYAVNKMSGNTAVLIDEPEISLHIDWQEDLLEKMMRQLGDRQIIVCTHSPAIAADFQDFMKKVSPRFNDMSEEDIDFLNDDEDDF